MVTTGDADVTVTGVCENNERLGVLVCTASLKDSGSGDSSGNNAIEDSCANLSAGSACTITYGTLTVDGSCEFNPDGNIFCMPEDNGYRN